LLYTVALSIWLPSVSQEVLEVAAVVVVGVVAILVRNTVIMVAEDPKDVNPGIGGST